ncbi:methylated-DNA--[protein]-cysteine S-methyltransferase [Nostocoides australiense]|nr:methylated-DNA--[protein]-cysteine S-methyltransferase [Austwickia sp.]
MSEQNPGLADPLPSLDPASPIDVADLTALHARLIAGAKTEGLIDIAYRTVDSPVGPLLVAATSTGLVRVAFEIEDFDRVLAALAALVSPRILHTPHRLDIVARALDDYFAGRRTGFDLPLDHALSSGFRERVQRHLVQIPYGQTTTYGQLAADLGSPRAVRAVGTACSTNPLPIIQPCHRVLRGDGALGGYLGGVHVKRSLIALETGNR